MHLHPEDASITTGNEGEECTVYPAELIRLGECVKKEDFEIHRYSSHYACSCPAWRFQTNNVKQRTCKHLSDVLGDEYERRRVRMAEKVEENKTRQRDESHPPHDPYRSPETTPSKRVKWTCSKASETLHIPISSQEIRISTGNGDQITMGWRDKKLFVLLAQTWPDGDARTSKGSADPSGWWISEKLDGVRAIWDGSQLWSRNGRLWAAPSWFTDCAYPRANVVLPNRLPLDGELWIGRGLFELTSSVCRSKVRDKNSPRLLMNGIK